MSDVPNVEAHAVVHHHGALEPAEGAANKGTIAGFVHPGLGSSVVSVEQDLWKRVTRVRMLAVIVVGGRLIDKQCCIL